MDITGDIDGGLQLLDVQNGNELPSDNVNISDVLEAVEAADPTFGAEAVAPAAVGVVGSMSQPPAMPPASVQIIEQPAPKALRFRYECEGRSAGSIPGVHSVPDNKTFPTIRISNHVGQVTIVVSCVTKDKPYRAHPHNLVGRDGCERGVCTIRTSISEAARDVHFKNLGIQCVKRRDIADALQARATLRVDPFRNGFEHRNNPQSIDLNAVRLAFQVFVHQAGGQLFQLPPAVSDTIYDKKAMNDLLIVRASHCSGPVAGGTQIVLLCDKVTREDTAVVFYQEDGAGRRVWEQAANTMLVHKQVAMVVETPPYRPPYYSPGDHRGQITVNFQLKRLTDKQQSNSLTFEYIPEFQDSKRRKTVMQSLIGYSPESYSLEPPIKMEPNRTPPQIFSPPMPAYNEAQQWRPLQPMVGGSHHNPFHESWAGYGPGAAGAPGPGLPGPGAGPGYSVHSPPAHGSPLGALSPPHNLQSPLMPGQASPLGPPLGPPLSPPLHAHPPAPLQPPPPYQAQDMETSAGTSLSALLGAVGEPLPHDLFSLSSLEDREGLSDSLRQLSTNDLFRQ